MPRRWFRIAYAGNALRRMLAEHGTPVASFDAATGISSMLEFSARYQPQHGETDALWCSWGPSGDVFEFSFARRMTRHGHPEVQVLLVLSYRLTPARRLLSGEATFTTSREAKATAGYHEIARARPLGARLEQC